MPKRLPNLKNGWNFFTSESGKKYNDILCTEGVIIIARNQRNVGNQLFKLVSSIDQEKGEFFDSVTKELPQLQTFPISGRWNTSKLPIVGENRTFGFFRIDYSGIQSQEVSEKIREILEKQISTRLLFDEKEQSKPAKNWVR